MSVAPQERSLPHRVFMLFSWVAFQRNRSMVASIFIVLIALYLEIKFGWTNLFASSGAIVSLAGLFLNIKYSLHFHLPIPKDRIYYMLSGMGVLGKEPSENDLRWVDEILRDEMFGVALMISGTIIWAFGGYLMALVKSFSC